jgi:hypothetical protein
MNSGRSSCLEFFGEQDCRAGFLRGYPQHSVTECHLKPMEAVDGMGTRVRTHSNDREECLPVLNPVRTTLPWIGAPCV